MILAEDEIGLGSDHAGIMLLPDGIEPGTPLADVLPVREQVLDVTPTMNRVDLLSMVGLAREVATLFDGELKPIEVEDPTNRPSTARRGDRREPGRLPALHRPGARERDRRPVADVAPCQAPRGGDALDLERRRHHELRHARLRQSAARVRPRPGSPAGASPFATRVEARRCGRSMGRCVASTSATF